MQVIAVILAAVAVLAATTQAFLLWQDRDHTDAMRIHERRVTHCETAIMSLDRLQGDVAAAEERFAELESEGLTDDEKSSVARSLFEGSSSIYFSTLGAGTAKVYFTTDEFDAVGFEELEEASNFTTHLMYTGFAVDVRFTKDDVKAALDAYRAAAVKLDSAKTVCAPIMLGKVR